MPKASRIDPPPKLCICGIYFDRRLDEPLWAFKRRDTCCRDCSVILRKKTQGKILVRVRLSENANKVDEIQPRQRLTASVKDSEQVAINKKCNAIFDRLNNTKLSIDTILPHSPIAWLFK